MKSAIKELEEKGRAAKAASRKLAFLSTEIKNKALLNIARALIAKQDEILAANKIDYEEAKASGMSEAMLDRLMLSPSRLEGMAQDVKTVRNAIVHTSAEAKSRFESLIRSKLGYAREGITPGDFLATIVADKDMSYITYYSELLESASE